MLTDQQLLIYNRQIMLDEIGPRGQERLGAARVAVVGLGGLGSSAALYLGAAGIGTLVLIDHDKVALSNLQRQILYDKAAVGQPKTTAAAASLQARNPELCTIVHFTRLQAENGASLLEHADFVIDATDHPESKFLLAELCHRQQIPYSHAGVAAFQGQTMTVLPGATACLRCLFSHSQETNETLNCNDRGIVGAVPGVIGSLQALEAVKHIAGAGKLLTNRMLVFDGLHGEFRLAVFRRNPQCSLCGKDSTRSGNAGRA